jgi:GAF domain-containing protein
MAVSNAQQDERWAAEIGERVGYMPNSILCVPLFYEDAVIGVLELLDKEGAGSFDDGDIATLSLFANQAAVAIGQSRTQEGTEALVAAILRASVVDGPNLGGRHPRVQWITRGDETRRSLRLAELSTIGREGEQGSKPASGSEASPRTSAPATRLPRALRSTKKSDRIPPCASA